MRNKLFIVLSPLARLWLMITLVTVLATTVRAATVVQVSAGRDHTLFIMSDHSLWGMGDESGGELGQGFGLTQTNLPIQIIPGDVTNVACGTAHSMFVESDGSLWGMGEDMNGQLGDGTNVNHYFPEKVVSANVNAVAAGNDHTLYRTAVGSRQVTVSLLGMGDNGDGELGDGSAMQETPVIIQSTTIPADDVVAFAGGQGDTLFVRSNGSLWGMGYDVNGELGNGGTIDQSSPVQIDSNVVAVAAGSFHSLFLKTDGELWGMGENFYGALGDTTQIDHHSPEQIGINVTAISAGGDFSLFIKTDGSLWGMGKNDQGQLGDGTFSDRYAPVQIVPSNVVAVAAGFDHSLFIKSDGSLWGMGYNGSGELGDGTSAGRFFPVRIVPPPPSPVLTGFSSSGNNVTVHASNGLFGATYYVITSTNMALPSALWTSVATNQLNADGNFTIIATNAVMPAAKQQFFRIQLLY